MRVFQGDATKIYPVRKVIDSSHDMVVKLRAAVIIAGKGREAIVRQRCLNEDTQQ